MTKTTTSARVRAIQESIKSHDTSDKQSLFEVLVVSTKFSHQSEEEESRKASSDLAELALRHLLYLTSSKTTRHSEMENYILDLLPQLIVVKDIKSVSFLSPFWDKLVSNTLRCLFMNSKLLKLLCQLVPIVYSASSSSSAQTMFHMCINHTAFMNVMMAPEHAKAKSELVHLLYLLGEFEPSVYAPGLSKALIGSYNATLSETDQRLLLMIKKCQKDSDKKFECPCVWGKAAAEYHTVSKVLGPSLDKEASVKSIIEQLNQQQMVESMLHFPLRRTQKCTSIMEASEFKSESSCYDPNFLLPLFVQILSPDKIVPLQLFVERGCLSYLLVALSSHDVESRLLAYHALNDFYQHAEGSRWQERKEINFLLDLLNSSRDKTGQKLPYVIALFFARVVKLLLHPADPLYVPIFKFLLAKPEIDLHNVPEFYQLFFSSTLQYKQERCWLLSLLSDGVRETSDYWIYQRKLIFKIIFSFYDSALCDDKSQVLILKTMKNALKEKFIAVDLVKKHGLMAWLLGVSKSLSSCPQHTDVVCELVYTLWSSLNSMRYNKSPASTKKHQTQKSVNMDEEDESETGVKSDESMEDNNENKTNKEGEVETSCRNRNNERDICQKCPSASVPTSTRVEIGLVIKCLIWNLNNASYESLLKLLDVILSLLTTETGSPQEHTDNTVKDLTRANVCTSVNLTCLETCLLLYHVANAAQLEKTAKSARDLLHKKGVILGVPLDTSVKKVNKRPQNKLAKVSSSKQQQLQDVDELENGHDEDMTGDVIKLDSEAELYSSNLLQSNVNVSAGEVTLSIDPPEILLELTSSLDVTCTFQRTATSMSSILSIVISHSNTTADPTALNYIASINEMEGQAHIIDKDVTEISGSINNNGESFLRFSIPISGLGTSGIYQCDVMGFDHAGKPINITNSSTVEVVEPDLRSLFNEMKRIKTTTEKQQKSINSLNSRLEAMKQSMFHTSQPYNNHRYYLIKGLQYFIYSEAQAVCELYGGYLVELDSHEEYIFVRDFIQHINVTPLVMTGATDADQEGIWVNQHYNATAGQTFDWAPGEPKDGSANNCQCYGQPSFLLYDCNCDFTNKNIHEAGYMCEIPE
ncbi:nucleolar pre-ribosomal-associated protein 1 [Bulinus truncatus]|nr:nucleolar pre-ribosomal-associated protein 1 [Bulinus truncatus]